MNAGRITIIGAGPAGLMAADILASRGHHVTIHERMPSPARKFLMAGRGGLNLTHSEELEIFLSRYGPARADMENAIRSFPPQALRDWAQGLGQETFIGSSGRVFPESFKASPLLRAWLTRLHRLGVKLVTRSHWQGWDSQGNLVFERAGSRITEPAAQATLLALGGASWPRLGADGSWTGHLRTRGVTVTPLQPANSGMEIGWSQTFRERFAGMPLKRIALTLGQDRRMGEAMITDYGLEGGIVYALNATLRQALTQSQPVSITLDLKPDTEQGALAASLAVPRKGQSLANFLRKRLKLSPQAINLLREAASSPLPAAPDALADRIKHLQLKVTRLRGMEKAISSAGGIAFDQTDGHFMLRSMSGVFVAGEMLDWDAPTGGYLLQGCFSTAVAAAGQICQWLVSQEQRHSPCRPQDQAPDIKQKM